MTTLTPPLDAYGEPEYPEPTKVLEAMTQRIVSEALEQLRREHEQQDAADLIEHDMDAAGARCIELCDDAVAAAVAARVRWVAA